MNAHARIASKSVAVSLEDLLVFVREHSQGVSALHLQQHFIEKGYDGVQVQRVVQGALDRGTLRIGHQLRIVA